MVNRMLLILEGILFWRSLACEFRQEREMGIKLEAAERIEAQKLSDAQKLVEMKKIDPQWELR